MGDTRASSLANQEGLEDVTGLARVEEGVNAGKKKKKSDRYGKLESARTGLGSGGR